MDLIAALVILAASPSGRGDQDTSQAVRDAQAVVDRHAARLRSKATAERRAIMERLDQT